MDAAIVAVPGSEKKQAQLLLIQRRNSPCKGMWALPGGFVDENESLDTAAARELQEETSVDPKDVTLFQVGPSLFVALTASPLDGRLAHALSDDSPMICICVYWRRCKSQEVNPMHSSVLLFALTDLYSLPVPRGLQLAYLTSSLQMIQSVNLRI